ncbi:MAG: glycine cleavage system protein GcvH [Nitrospirae bacterium]|nr:glycine cleavage system protein GcvH [Nitrospirota bacterium]
MALINGCNIPEDLYYDGEHDVWVRFEDDTVVVGMTDIAQSLAGRFLYAHIKEAGKHVEAGKSIATVESSKWVGPVRTPIAGEIIAVNEKVEDDPRLINKSPYNDGWIARLRCDDIESAKAKLITGEAAVEVYRKRMEKENVKNHL